MNYNVYMANFFYGSKDDIVITSGGTVNGTGNFNGYYTKEIFSSGLIHAVRKYKSTNWIVFKDPVVIDVEINSRYNPLNEEIEAETVEQVIEKYERL